MKDYWKKLSENERDNVLAATIFGSQIFIICMIILSGVL